MPTTIRNVFIAAACGLSISGAARADDPAERGHDLVRQHCIRCHIVDESNRFTGISSTPSFKTLITALPDWSDRFATFQTRNPHPSIIIVEGMAPPGTDEPANVAVELSLGDIDAINAYIERYAADLDRGR